MSVALKRGLHRRSAPGAEPSKRDDRKRLAKLRQQRLLLGTAAAAIVTLAAGSSRAVVINDSFDPAGFTVLTGGGGLVNGVDANNLFPNVVSINNGSCTGTLISAQMVVTAAHCFYDNGVQTIENTTVGFTSATGGAVPATTQTASVVIVNGGYNEKDSNNDIALVILPKKVTTVTPATRAPSIPANFTAVIVAGFGAYGTGSKPPTSKGPFDDKRRVAQTALGKQDSLDAYPSVSGKQNALFAQFRNPSNPTAFNYFKDAANPTKAEGGVAPADSGSPMFYCPLAACMPSQLLQIGELIGGAALPAGAVNNGYGEINAWTPLPLFATWIDGNDPALAVTAQPGTHKWSSPDTWAAGTKFATAAGAPATLPTESSVVWLDEDNTTITLDINATNESLWITGANSSLSIPQTFTLTEADSVLLEDGMLTVNGKLATPMVSIEGGTLNGSGTIDTRTNGGASTGIVANFNGKVAPGSPTSTGTLTIVGDYFQGPSGILLIKIAGNDADKLAVIGNAALNGTVQAMFGTGSYLARTRTILSAADGLDGTFSNLTTGNLPASFTANLSYTNTDVLLNLTASLGAGGGLSGNQQNVTNALNSFFNNGGALPPAFVTIFGLGGGNLANALGQLSGEAATGGQQATFNAMTAFLGILTDPSIDGRGAAAGGTGATPFAEDDSATAYAAAARKRASSERDAYGMITKAPLREVYDPRWSVWASGFGGSQTTDGNAAIGSNTATSRIFGTAVGADVLLSPRTIAGFAFAGGGTNFVIANSLGSGHSDLFQAGAFVRHNVGAAYISGALAYGWQDVTTNRTITVAGIDQLQARFNANAWSGRLEGGYRFVTPWMNGIGITPYAAGQFTTFDLPAYAEQALSGSNTFALAYGSKSVTASRSELGVRIDKSLAVSNAILTLRSRLGWAHDYNPDRGIAAAFQTLPGASFVVNGAAQAHDSALTTAAAEMKWMSGWSAAVTFEGEFSSVATSYAGKGLVRYQW